MVQVNELRIGNICRDGKTGELLSVEQLSKDDGVTFHVVNRDKYPLPDGWYAEYLPLTPKILEQCGFSVDVWSRLAINEYTTMFVGRCDTESGLPYRVGVEQDGEQGFTIQEAAELQNKTQIFDDNAYFLLRPDKVFLLKINHLHQLQNIYFSFTGKELKINL